MNVRTHTQEDTPHLITLMKVLQNHIADLDPLHLNKSGEDFDAERYIENMLATVLQEHGVVFIAKEEATVIGFIVGVIHTTTQEEAIEIQSTTNGRILELVVDPAYRGKHIGKALMESMEHYFREQGCAYIRVECFAPNTGAHAFYETCGYEDRSVEMIKKVIKESLGES